VKIEAKKEKARQALVKLIMLSMFTAIGVVISPILRFEGFAPTAHLVNVVCAVFMGPWYALVNGIITAILRMTLMGIPPLAITGQVFGAFFAGLFYRASQGRKNDLIFATAGEIIGTGLIGSVMSYPVMTFIVGREGLHLFFYTIPFTGASCMGAGLAYAALKVLKRNGMLGRIHHELGVKTYELQKKS
jgi:energy coupling factor transporter S component ThiW